ncbi:hypothetical protein BU204_18790 [Actinophytocola xanthii]|uniref:DUF11 domain-containing protein n=1 Tax=Actinophytocola xanthii TaxID=1912961 RepID=A0A1Q8CNQ4_9PSEU|nr:hypothetical protein BU204_18790 [Actinophytocola xanthii]
MSALAVALVASVVSLVAPGVAEAAVREPFNAVYSAEENGAITLIGASSMTCPTAASGCAAARTATASGTQNNNNVYNMVFADVDADATTSNSSTATLALPSGSTVLHARLVWGARTGAGTNGTGAATPINSVRLRTPGSSGYSTVTATTVNQPAALISSTTDRGPYQSSLDITQRVRTAGNGAYTVANISAATGQDRYAGWSMVVAYRNPALPLRDLRVFEGFADVTPFEGNDVVDIPVSGFLTPTTGPVNASVGVVAWEGDFGTTGDSLRLAGTTLSDPTHPATNFFNSRISDGGVEQSGRNPAHVNNFGVDISRIATTDVLPTGSTSTTIRLSTTGEAYYPGIVTSQIDLFTPQFDPVSKSVVNLSGNAPARPGDVLEYRISYTNSGGDAADASVIRDVVPANVTYVPGSLAVIAAPGATAGPRTDAAGDDTADYTAGDRTVRFRVGTGASATAGGTLVPGATASVRFRVTVARAAAGGTITNGSFLDYRARTINRSFTFAGNEVSTQVLEVADLVAAKTASAATLEAGRPLTYTVSARNDGPSTATDVVLTDQLPAGTTFESAAAPAGTTCTPSGQTVTCRVASLAAEATVSVPIVARVGPGTAEGVLTNAVQVSAATADDIAANNVATASTSVTRAADLAVTASLAPDPVVPGTPATLTTTVTNRGPSSARAVVLSTPLPADITSASGEGCSVAAGTVTCTVGELAPGASRTVRVRLDVPANAQDTTLTTNTVASSGTPDAEPTNNAATAAAPLAPLADVQVATSAPAGAVAGTETTVTVTVTNAGPSDAADVRLTHSVPEGAEVVLATPQAGSCSVSEGVAECLLETLPAGTSTTIVLRIRIAPDAEGLLVNEARATTATRQDVTGNDSASSTVTVSRVSDLELDVTATPRPVIAGEPLTYTVTVTNHGPSAADAVTVEDILPAGLTLISANSTQGSCGAVDGAVSCALGTLAADAVATITVTAATPGTVPPGGFANTATVRSASTDPESTTNAATYVASVDMQAEVWVSTTAGDDPVVAGESRTFVVTVGNEGPSTARSTVLTQTLAPGLRALTATPSAGSCTVEDERVRCELGDLADGEEVTVSITTAVPAGQPEGEVTESVSVTSDTFDPSESNNVTAASTVIRTAADLRVTGVQYPEPFTAGEEFTASATFTNAGPSDARDTVFVLDLPEGMYEMVASVGGVPCTISGQRVFCSVGTVAVGQTVVVEAAGRVDPSGRRESSPFGLTLSSAAPDPVPEGNHISGVAHLVTAATVDLAMRADQERLVAGARAIYRITATNAGPSDATSVRITDTVPEGVTVVSATSALGSCTVADRVVTCDVPRLPAGAVAEVVLVVDVAADAEGPLLNSAELTSATPAPGGTRTASVESPVEWRADLVLTGSATPAPVRAGAAVTYTLTVTNAGPSAAEDVVLSDVLPEGVTLLPGGAQAENGTCTTAGRDVSCVLAGLEPGQSTTVVLTAAVPQALAADTVLTNTATVASPTPDPTPADRRLELATSVVTEADLAVVASTATSNPEAGRELQQAVTVTNSGPSLARAVTVTVPIPAGSTFVEGTTGCTADADAVRCELGNVGRGSIRTVRYTLLLAPDYPGPTLTSEVTVRSATADATPADNTTTTTQTISASADLVAGQELTSGTPVAGRQVTYRISAVNAGPSQAPQVILTDSLPQGATPLSVAPSAGGECVADASTVRCTWPTLAVGASVAAEVTVLLASGTPAGSTLTNTVTATAAVADVNPSDNVATTTAPVATVADVSVLTRLSSGPPVAGGRATWQVVVHNGGPSAAAGVVVDDRAPAGVRFDRVETTLGSCTSSATAVRCTVGALAANESATMTVSGVLAADYVGTRVTNTASVTATTTDPDPSNNSSSADSDTTSSAELALTMAATPDPVVPGRAATWTMTVDNAGPSAARDVVVTTELPAGVTARPSAGCEIAGQRVTCALGDVAAGSSAAVEVSGLVSAGFVASAVTATATVTSGTADHDPRDDTATTSTSVRPEVDLSVDVIAPESIAAGSVSSWTVRVLGSGPSDARAVAVRVLLPRSLTNVRASWADGQCAIDDAVADCALGVVPAGKTTDITVTGSVPSTHTGSMALSAEVSAAGVDPNSSNNTGGATQTTISSADLATTLTGPDAVVPGRPLTLVLTTRNFGPSTATGVEVVHTLPAQLTDVVASTTAGSCTVSGREVTCPVGDLGPGATVLVSITGTPSSALTEATLDSTARGRSNTEDPDPDDNAAALSIPVTPVTDLRLATAVTSGPPVAGAPIEFLVEVANAGPSDARSVVVTDTVPSSVGALTATTPDGECSVTGQVVRCELDGLTAGDTPSTITIRGIVADGTTEPITNVAAVTSATSELTPNDNTSAVTASATDSANVAMTVDVVESVVAGQPLTYTVTVTNAGPSTARDVVLVPEEVPGLLDIGVDHPGCTSPTGCALGDIAPGESVVLRVHGVVDPDSRATALVARASVSATTPDPDGRNNAISSRVAVSRSADLAVELVNDPRPAVPGQTVLYTATVTSRGPSAAQNVVTLMELPAGTDANGEIRTSQGSCTQIIRSIVCDLGSVLPAEPVTITIPIVLSPSFTGDRLDTTVTAQSVTPDPDPADDSATTQESVTPLADLSVEVAGPADVAPGGAVRWTLTVRNAGPSDAPAELVYTLPAGVGEVAAVASGGSCSVDGREVRCVFPTLGVGTETTVTVTGVLAPAATAATVVGTATLTSPVPEPAPTEPDGRSASATTEVEASSGVSVNISPDHASASPGSPFSWTVIVTNAGPSTARDVTVRVTAPEGVTGLAITAPDAVQDCDTPDRCVLGNLSPGPHGAVRLTVRGTVAPGFTGPVLPAVATVSTSTPDPDPGDNSDEASTLLAVSADVGVALTLTPTTPVAGGALTLTATMENAGPADAAGLTVTFSPPAGMRDLEFVAPAGVTCRGLVCTAPTLRVGERVEIVLRGSLAPDAVGAVSASVSVTADTADPNTANNTAAVGEPVEAHADLSVTKTGPAEAVAGQTVTWRLTASSAGPSRATDVVVTDVLPEGVSLVSTDPACAAQDRVVRCAVGALDPGENRVVTIAGRVAPDTGWRQLTNIASITSPVADPRPAGNTAEVTTAVGQSADLSLTKTLRPDPIVAGEPATFTLTVANAGPSTAPTVLLTDPVAAGMSVTEVTSPDGDCGVAAEVVSCQLGPLAPGASATTTVTVAVDPDVAPGEVANNAAVLGDVPDPDLTNNAAVVAGGAATRADLSVTKVADRVEAESGDPLTWTVTVANSGPSSADEVVMVDLLPAGVEVSEPPTGCTVTGRTMRCLLDQLAPGATRTLSVASQVRPDADTADIVNAVSVLSTTAEGNPANNVADAITPLRSEADLSVAKSVESGPVVPGEQVTWMVEIANAGPSTADDVRLTDPLPAGVRFVSADVDSCTVTEGVLECAVDALAAGTTTRVRVVGEVDPSVAGEQLTNTAVVASATPDPETGDNTALAAADLRREVALALTKTADAARAQVGTRLTWTVTATNDGPSSAPGVSVLDRLPAGVTLLSARADRGEFDPATGFWALGPVAPGDSPSLTLTVRLDRVGQLTNTATLTAAGVFDATADDDTASSVTEVTATPPPSPAPQAPPGSGGGGQVPSDDDEPPLAFTGYAVLRWLAAGLLLVLAGVGFVLGGRRRSRRRARTS